jgi:hypothetical protein
MDAHYFDRWYADMGDGGGNLRFSQQQLGLRRIMVCGIR